MPFQKAFLKAVIGLIVSRKCIRPWLITSGFIFFVQKTLSQRNVSDVIAYFYKLANGWNSLYKSLINGEINFWGCMAFHFIPRSKVLLETVKP